MRELVQVADIKATSYKLVNARKALVLNENRDRRETARER